VLLAGCGSRESSRPETSAPPPERQTPATQPAADNRKVLAAFGDSLTAGFGAEPGHSYPDYLQKEIDAKGYPWRVVNFGVSGATSTDGLTRIAEVLDAKPAIVVLELGANDGLRGIPVDRMRENLDETIAGLQKSGATVVLAGMTLPPNYGRDYIAGFESTFRDLAAKYKLPLIPFLLQGVGGNRQLMQADGLHPTATGNRRVADNVFRVVEPLLKQ
jgi:acyl-CoA thioesterase-1